MINHAYFSEAQVADILARAKSDAFMQSLVDAVMQEAKNGSGIRSLAFAYCATGEETYLTRAHEVLLGQLGDSRWQQSGDFTSTDLHTAAMCVQMAEGYSLFADKIPEEDRKRILHQTWELGIAPVIRQWAAPGHKVHAFDTMGHNWWPVCVASGALAAVVMCDDLVAEGISEAPELLQIAVDGLREWFAYPGNPMNVKPRSFDHGAFYEGMSYIDYLLHEYLHFAIVYKAIRGEHPFDDVPYLNDCAEFIVHASYESTHDKQSYHVDFGDADCCGYRHAPLHLLAYGIECPALRRYVRRHRDKTVDPLLRLCAYDAVYSGEEATLPEMSVCYDKIGWAIFRDSWEPDAAMLAVKCGDTWNHAHADAGHFILFRNGNYEIYDSGCPVSYSSPLYIPYYTDSIAHNTVLFEGRGQDFRDNYKNHAHNPGKLYNHVDKPGFRYIAADITGPMSRYFRKHHRHFIWIDGAIVIYDDIECYERGRVSYVLHAEEMFCHRMLTAHTTEIHEGWRNEEDSRGEYAVTYKRYTMNTDSEGHAKFVSVLMLDESLEPVFEQVENAYGAAPEEAKNSYRLTIGDTVLYINTRADGKVLHRNCDNLFDGIYTDAEVMLCKNGMPYAVVNGSVVREGKVGRWALDVWARITDTIPENDLRTVPAVESPAEA